MILDKNIIISGREYNVFYNPEDKKPSVAICRGGLFIGSFKKECWVEGILTDFDGESSERLEQAIRDLKVIGAFGRASRWVDNRTLPL